MKVVLAFAVLLLAAPVAAEWDDWRIGKSGDYAYIDGPPGYSSIEGVVALDGRAGNNKTVPQMGSEDNPVAGDDKADGQPLYTVIPNEPGTDIGNVWVTEDDGYTFDIRMRLHDDPPTYTAEGNEFVYSVNFTQTVTDVNYRVDARLKGGAYAMSLWVGTDDPLFYCLLDRPIDGGFSPMPEGGGIFSYRIYYGHLDVLKTPADPGAGDCADVVLFGAPAKAGDVLTGWRGQSTNSIGQGGSGANVETWAFADESDLGFTPYTLGPAGTPGGPFIVQFYVNGKDAGTATSTIPCAGCDAEWTKSIDFDDYLTLGCRYYVQIGFGTTTDELLLRGKNCAHLDGLPIIAPNVPPPDPAPLPPRQVPDPSGNKDAEARSDDRELDGYPDFRDACEFQRDPGVSDTDGDGVGDHCDGDIDGDKVPNGADNCPYDANVDQLDTDGNGIGDACDPDLDGDAWSDSKDNCPMTVNVLQSDRDGDGKGDLCDDDLDGDGVPNDKDAFPYDPREWKDTDGDGIGDNSDLDADDDGFSNEEETAAFTDPYDASSRPTEGPRYAHTAGRVDEGASLAQIGLTGGLTVLALVGIGLGLFFLVRPRP